ncbi:MAG: polysaccharide biosynthesis C-terminal domain-containing protein, partial [Lachnospiraceae bacterium]|nr:polysaccharide biosynthesis C-terminal domain-containing protein [Lachnospiraceae bacterium]
MNKRFQWKPFLSAVCAIAIPVALQNLLTNTGSIVDTMMIASLGEQSVAAVGLCEQFSILVFSCYWGFVSGGMMFISQYFGANDEAGMERSYGLMTAVCLFVALAASVLAVCFPHAVMSIYTDKPAIQAIGEDYVRIVGFAFPFNVLAVCSAGLLRATGHAKYPLYSSVMAVVVNVCLNYVLIYGHFGLPALGVKGAAIATVVSGVINFLSNHIFAKVHRIRYLFAFSAFFR